MFAHKIAKRIPCEENEVILYAYGTLFKTRVYSDVNYLNFVSYGGRVAQVILKHDGLILKCRNKSFLSAIEQALDSKQDVVDLTSVPTSLIESILKSYVNIINRYEKSMSCINATKEYVPFILSTEADVYMYAYGTLFKKAKVMPAELSSKADIIFTGNGVVISSRTEAHLRAFKKLFEDKTTKQIAQEVVTEIFLKIPSYIKNPVHNLKYQHYLEILKEEENV